MSDITMNLLRAIAANPGVDLSNAADFTQPPSVKGAGFHRLLVALLAKLRHAPLTVRERQRLVNLAHGLPLWREEEDNRLAYLGLVTIRECDDTVLSSFAVKAAWTQLGVFRLPCVDDKECRR